MRQALVCLLMVCGLWSEAGDSRYSVRQVDSAILGTSRTVRIYLPSSYAEASSRRYPVLYLHDGQNVFSFAGTNVAFGWGSWELDRTADQLSSEGRMREIIMIGIDNSPARLSEYSGRVRNPAAGGERTPFEKYAAFLGQELKPQIDRELRTLPDPANTATMGSSMGGICSIALAWEHPEVFGAAASLSGAFLIDGTNFLHTVLRPYGGSSKPLRLYLDSGAADFLGGDDGHALTEAVIAQFRRIGWSADLLGYFDAQPLALEELKRTGLRQDKWAEAQRSQHNEFYWRVRVWRPLTYLFPAVKTSSPAKK